MRLFDPAPMRTAPQLDPTFRPACIRSRHALLINPFYPKDPHASFGKHVLTPTLALTSVAAASKPDWEVRYWDENLLQGSPPRDPFPELVGITVHLTFARRAYELADWYRERGAKTVLGGLHVLSCPEEAAPHADALALGEGVRVWPQILRDVEVGRLQERYVGSFQKPFREEPPPRRAILDRRSFLTTSSLIATRGCTQRCNFCYLSTQGLHMPCQVRPVEDVAAEMAAEDQPYSVFIDNNLGANPEYLRALCRALRPLNRIWSAAVTVDVTNQPDLVREMALAGCTGVFVGFESLGPENLRAAGKTTISTRDYAERVAILHDCGIQVNGSFVLGFDWDGPDVFERTVEWIERCRLECATFHILTPYPGTPLFRRMDEEGRLLHKNWDLYDTAHVVFQPARMSPQRLAAGYAWCYRRLFSHASIWRRRPADPGAVMPYLGMSYLYKRANWLWPLLIRHRLTALLWRPLIELSRRRHLRFRRRLRARAPSDGVRASSVVSAGV